MVHSESRDATRASTPPPLPPLYRRRAQDRASISSVSTTSTTASSVIVSPTTPTRQEWSSVRIVSPMARDWAARGSWSSQPEEGEVDTPKNSFLAVDAPSRNNSKSPVGDSEKWWAGTTPTVSAPGLGQRGIDSTRMSQCSIVSLQDESGGSTSCHADEPLCESPTLGRLWLPATNGNLPLSPRSKPTVDDSPAIPEIFSAFDHLLIAPVRRSRVKRRPSLHFQLQDDAESSTSTIDFSKAIEGWSAKRLGKLPDTPQGWRLADDLHSNAAYMSRQASSSSLTSTRSSSTSRSKTSLPSIPTRKSSRGPPPIPPTRTSSLDINAVASSSSPAELSVLSSFPSAPTRSSLRSVSDPSSSRSITPPAAASSRNLKRRSTGASSRISSLETVPESPRDLDTPPDPAWALRPRPRRLHRSKSEPDLRDHLPGTMMQRLRMKRAEPGSSKAERRKSIGAFLSLEPKHLENLGVPEKPRWTLSSRRGDRARQGLPDLWPKVDSHTPVVRIPPRLELSFVPSRPAPRPPVESPATHQAVAPSVDFTAKVDYYEEALHSIDSAEEWSWPNPPHALFPSQPTYSSRSSITPSSSGYTLGGPLTPPSIGLPPCLPPVPDTPVDYSQMSERDLLHGELEFELAEERRQRMKQRQNMADFGLPGDYSSHRKSLAPAWQGQAF